MAELENGVDAGEAKSESGTAGKARSEISYPYFGLSHGIKVVEAVRRAGGNEAPSAAVMQELGIEKITDRLWSYGVPSAMQFGLVERVGRGDSGRIKVTDLGMRVVLPEAPEEARAAKIAAFKMPELYAKLLERYAGAPVPSKEGLRNILFRDFKILETMTAYAADAFLDSLKVAELITSGNTISGSVPTALEEPAKKTSEAPKEEIPTLRGKKAVYVPADYIVYPCKIGKGRFIEVPLPPHFTKSELTKLHAFLETQVDDDEEDGASTLAQGGQK